MDQSPSYKWVGKGTACSRVVSLAQPRISATAIAAIASFTSQPTAQDAAIAGASFTHSALTTVNGNGPTSQIANANLRSCAVHVKVQAATEHNENPARKKGEQA